jgi:phage terminase large subunit-like protein
MLIVNVIAAPPAAGAVVAVLPPAVVAGADVPAGVVAAGVVAAGVVAVAAEVLLDLLLLPQETATKARPTATAA